jgi:hypothetical protein
VVGGGVRGLHRDDLKYTLKISMEEVKQKMDSSMLLRTRLWHGWKVVEAV